MLLSESEALVMLRNLDSTDTIIIEKLLRLVGIQEGKTLRTGFEFKIAPNSGSIKYIHLSSDNDDWTMIYQWYATMKKAYYSKCRLIKAFHGEYNEVPFVLGFISINIENDDCKICYPRLIPLSPVPNIQIEELLKDCNEEVVMNVTMCDLNIFMDCVQSESFCDPLCSTSSTPLGDMG